MPRLFTGIEIPPGIAEALAPFRGGLPGARWIESADYHITLRFLGDVERSLAEDLCEGLAEARPRAPIPITLEGLSSFGGDKPRALYAAVSPVPDLVDLQAEQERIARRAGAEPERRKFTPHVTLARLRREASPEAVAMYLSQAPIFEPLRFEATRVALFSARESTGGGPYVTEAVFPFA
ncbi:RNA 2',3'-cyclic phosphodiesterase [Methylobacterium oxalidis]|uniref:RNA 2',3'-cyclic phosphodiesterase n=1 Tax=Methylobacterium oxalidis TaxID=944322 RepID=A0A512IY93_9HYPH|nr:RNA 2',3'-cyclic phosphodiesterase [Methylobacterium oxalidis]GEP02666.1 RNA 2',3'-cyclic phosphodiesterase [Methylobacterium oxalidis]GLS61875.1 RNA 2',3'-cyclic phosphodiesterase [Methylobacterium oxalidis]